MNLNSLLKENPHLDPAELSRLCASEAIGVQEAVNVSGVLYAWKNVVSALWHIANSIHRGTEWVNHHPVNILFLSKVESLVLCSSSPEAFAYGYAWCKRAEKKEATIDYTLEEEVL